jgi:uncharacterized protein (TIGR02757 family)
VNTTGVRRLRVYLDALRQKLNIPYLVKNDPVQFVHKFKKKNDIEIAGFFASHLAFGRVKMIIKNLEKLFSIMEWSPYDFVMDFKNTKSGPFSDFVHRFINGRDVETIVSCLKEVYRDHSGLEDFFLEGYSSSDKNLLSAINRFVDNFYSLQTLKNAEAKAMNRKNNAGIHFFIPPPGSKSAYKRLNLFLRWMVRYEKGLDTGLWKRIKPSQLIIPLDTHIARISENIGLTRKKTHDMKMAVEITENLKLLDSEDPLKYDFVLCHMGISERCRGRYEFESCGKCKLFKICMFIK